MTSRYSLPNNKITRAEATVGLFFALTAFRWCTLPAQLARVAAESMVYAVLAGFAMDVALALLCLGVSRRGGLAALSLRAPLRKGLALLVGVFCLAKVVFYTTEMVMYATADLFDEAMALPLALALLVVAALMSTKGFAGVGRTALVCGGVGAVLLVLVFIFTSYSGYGYNLWVLLRPHGVGQAFWRSMPWVGDGLLFLLVDTSTSVHSLRDYRPVRWGAALAMLLTTVVLLLSVYTYGSAIADVPYTFARLFVNNIPESLGAVDWPMLLLWLVLAMVHLANLFCAATAAIGGLPREGARSHWPIAVAYAVAAAGYIVLHRDKDALSALSGSLAANITLFAVAVGCGVGCWALSLAASRRQAAQGDVHAH